jgi:organic hydroperoxide reductase OsmC/OhrA
MERREGLKDNQRKAAGYRGGNSAGVQRTRGVWSPEHLFVASLNTCYVLTFLAIAEFSKIDVVSLSSSAKGKLEKVAGSSYKVTEIVVKPKVVIASVDNLARMPRILEKAKENCFVSNSIKSTIKLEPEIFHQQTSTTPCPLG